MSAHQAPPGRLTVNHGVRTSKYSSIAASIAASMAANRMSVAALCIATTAAGCVLATSPLILVILFPAAIPNVRYPGRVMVILPATVRVGHIAGFSYPRPARDGVKLYLVARVDPGARDRVAPGIAGLHRFNHKLPHLKFWLG